MLTYDGEHLTSEQMIKFEESMTFSDAEGYSKKDTDRILKHFSHCSTCREKRGNVTRSYLADVSDRAVHNAFKNV